MCPSQQLQVSVQLTFLKNESRIVSSPAVHSSPARIAYGMQEISALLNMGSYSYGSTTLINSVSVLGQSLNLLSSILTILLTCPNSDT